MSTSENLYGSDNELISSSVNVIIGMPLYLWIGFGGIVVAEDDLKSDANDLVAETRVGETA